MKPTLISLSANGSMERVLRGCYSSLDAHVIICSMNADRRHAVALISLSENCVIIFGSLPNFFLDTVLCSATTEEGFLSNTQTKT